MKLNKNEILDPIITENSKVIEDVVFEITKNFTAELDEMIKICRQIMTSPDPITDKELEDLLLLLPTYMYFTNEGMELVGIKEDISKMSKSEKYNDFRKNLTGTVMDKNTEAELHVMNESINYIIYQRSYKIIRSKIELAGEVLNALKKINDKRLKELNISGKVN